MPAVLATKLTREHGRALLALEAEQAARIAEIHEAARLELRGRLASLGDGSFTAQQVRVTLAQVEAGLASLQTKANAQFSSATAAALEQAVAQTLSEIAFHDEAFRGAASGPVRVEAMLRLDDTSSLLINRFQASIATYAQGLRAEIQRTMQHHLLLRSSFSEMSVAVAGRLRAHTIAGSAWRASRIVRTEMNNVLNTGHQATLEVAAGYVPGLKRQADATIDARTSDICHEVNGQVVGLNEPFRYEGREWMLPPFHPWCRTRVIGYHDDWVGEPAPGDETGSAVKARVDDVEDAPKVRWPRVARPRRAAGQTGS